MQLHRDIIYEGEFKMATWHGYGRVLYNKIASYEGNISNGCFKGEGEFKDFTTGKVVKGKFNNSLKDMNELNTRLLILIKKEVSK